MNLIEATTIPANAVSYRNDGPDIPVGLTHVEKADRFYEWMDANYPTDNIVMTPEQFKEWCEAPFNHQGTWFTTLLANTEPAMYAKDQTTGEKNPYRGHIRKLCRCQVQTGPWSYMNAVNNARLRLVTENDGPVFFDGQAVPPMDGDTIESFQPLPRKWGDRVRNSPMVVHTKKGDTFQTAYLEARPLRWLGNAFYVDGEPVTDEDYRRFMRDNSEVNAKQALHEGLTVDTMVHVRDWTVSNIVSARYANRTIWQAN